MAHADVLALGERGSCMSRASLEVVAGALQQLLLTLYINSFDPRSQYQRDFPSYPHDIIAIQWEGRLDELPSLERPGSILLYQLPHVCIKKRKDTTVCLGPFEPAARCTPGITTNNYRIELYTDEIWHFQPVA